MGRSREYSEEAGTERRRAPWQLSDFIRQRQGEILLEWERAARRLAGARCLDRAALLDQLPDLLEQISSVAAEIGGARHSTSARDIAELHALERLEEGFSLGEVVEELALLRGAILNLWERDHLVAHQLSDLRLLDQAIDRAILASVDRFTKARDRTLLESATRRSEAEKAARADAERALAVVDALLSSSLIGLGFIDTRLRYVRVNEALAALNGPSAAEHVGRTVREVLGAYADVVEPILRRVMETGVPVTNLELTATPPATPDRERTFSVSYFPVRIPSGETIGVGAAIVEITERRQAEARLQKALSISTVGVLFFDLMGRMLDANPALERLSGYSCEELRQIPWKELTPPEFEAVAARAAHDMATTGETAPYEKQWIRPDGSRWWGLFAPTRIGGTGHQSECVEFIIDITRRKEAEQALRESELLFRALADGIAQLAWMADETGAIFWYNQRWFEYTGTTFDEVKGWGWQTVHHPEHVRRVVEKIRHHFETGEIWEDTFPIRGKDGRYRWFLSRALPIRNEDGKVVRWFGTNTDVTETRLLADVATALSSSLDYRRTLAKMAEILVPTLADECVVDLLEREGELIRVAEVRSDPSNIALFRVDVPLMARGRTLGRIAIGAPESSIRCRSGIFDLLEELGRRVSIAIDNARLYEEAQRAIHMREEVLAVVSHDLKNPLGAIQLAGATLLRKQGADPRSRKQIEVINRSGSRMEHLIGDLLDMASIQAERLAIDRRLEDPEDVVVEAVESHEPAAREKGVGIVLACEMSGPPIPIDRDRILQVFGNLLGNAIKFCRAGDVITVRGERSAREVLLSVEDSGPGIPESDLAHVFEPYWSAKDHAKKGTGLGLYISKGVVEAHGGRLWVESKPSEGATFYFTLPVADARSISPPVRDPA